MMPSCRSLEMSIARVASLRYYTTKQIYTAIVNVIRLKSYNDTVQVLYLPRERLRYSEIDCERLLSICKRAQSSFALAKKIITI